MNPFEIHGPAYILVYLGVWGICLLAAYFYKEFVLNKNSGKTDLEIDLHPYEIAYLTGGEEFVVQAALSYLLHKGVVKVEEYSGSIQRLVIDSDPLEKLEAIHSGDDDYECKDEQSLENARDLESALCSSINGKSWSEVKSRLSTFSTQLERMRTKLVQNNLLARSSQKSAIDCVFIFASLIPAFIFGLPRLFETLFTHRPAGILVVLVIFTFILMWVIIAMRTPNTADGDRYVTRQKDVNRGLYTSASNVSSPMNAGDLALALAIFGPTMMVSAGFQQEGMKTFFAPVTNSSSGGCSGCGGCGGGCGGCGGCGG